MRMIIYLPQNKHRFALLLVLALAHCACLANTSVKSDVYRQLYGKSMMQAFAVAQAYETKGDKTLSQTSASVPMLYTIQQRYTIPTGCIPLP